MLRKENECDMHFNEKKRKFCKDSGCWERLCPYCAIERHATHHVVDFATLLAEIKAEKERITLDNGKVLSEYKTLLLDLEQLQKQVADKHSRLKVEEKKLQIQVETQLKSMSNSILSQKERLQGKIKRTVEDINASRNQITKDMNKMARVVEQISLKGDGYEVREFFDVCVKGKTEDPMKYREIVSDIQKDSQVFQETSPVDIFRGVSSPILPAQSNFNTNSSKADQRPLKTRNKSISSLSPNKKYMRHTYSIIPKITALPLEKSPKSEKTGLEEHLERLRKSLEKVTFQINEKTATLTMLDTIISTKNEQIAALEKKREQLVKTNETLQEYVEKQNKMFAESAVTFHPASTNHSSNFSWLSPTRRTIPASTRHLSSPQRKEILEIIRNLKGVLEKHGCNLVISSESLAVEPLIKEIDAYWTNLSEKAAAKEEKEELNDVLTKKDLTISQLTDQKQILKRKVEELRAELKAKENLINKKESLKEKVAELTSRSHIVIELSGKLKEVVVELTKLRADYSTITETFTNTSTFIKGTPKIIKEIGTLIESLTRYKQKYEELRRTEEANRQVLLDQCYLLERKLESSLNESIAVKIIIKQATETIVNKIAEEQKNKLSHFGTYFNAFTHAIDAMVSKTNELHKRIETVKQRLAVQNAENLTETLKKENEELKQSMEQLKQKEDAFKTCVAKKEHIEKTLKEKFSHHITTDMLSTKQEIEAALASFNTFVKTTTPAICDKLQAQSTAFKLANEKNVNCVKQLEELKIILSVRDKELEEARLETAKKLAETEDYIILAQQLKEKEKECEEKDKQMEQMYEQISAFEEEKQAIKGEKEKDDGELEELKKKIEEVEKYNEELQSENLDLKKE